MKKEFDYEECYRILGLSEQDKHPELKKKYRKLVSQWHPDKQLQVESAKAAEMIRKINITYNQLDDYFKKHQQLPYERFNLEEPENSQPALTESDKPVDTSTHVPPRVRQLKQIASIAFVSLFAILLTVFSGWERSTLHFEPGKTLTEPTVKPSYTLPPIQHGRFTYGDSFGKVIEVQGSPSSTNGNIWHYGNSYIVFTDGRVSDWFNHANNPLYSSITSVNRRTVIKVGSRKKDVLNIQGKPDIKSEEKWTYGASQIFFRNGLVSQWINSPMNPLKVELTIGNQSQ